MLLQELWAFAPVYPMHQPIVHVWTKFQLNSFHSAWEISNQNFSFMVNWKTYQGM